MFRKKKTKIQVINIEGVITASDSGSILNKEKGTEEILHLLHDIKNDESIAGVMLRLNSPGGTTGASQEIADMIEAIRATNRPVVASIADMACSGAYMIAAACDYIFANKLSLTGSIGVIMQVPNYRKLSEKLGVTYTTIKAGRMKDIGNPMREMTDEEKDYLEYVAKEAHAEFIAMVQKNRQIKNIEKMTDGRFVSAIEAKENGLIDAFGTYYDALDYLYERLGVEEDKVKLLEGKKKKSLLSRLLNLGSITDTVFKNEISMK